MKDQSGSAQFERHAREAFDASIEAMDAGTRSRLRQARHRAVDAATKRHAREWMSWAPVGALAAGVLAAALLLRSPLPGGSQPPPPMAATPATLTQGTIEMIAAGDEFEIATADEALEFYRWVEEATSNGAEGRS